MSKFKRSQFTLAVCLIVLLVLGLVMIFGIRPAMPSQWNQLQAGMTRPEVLAVLGGDVTDMRDLKGFDVTSYETTMFGSSSYWQLILTYNASGRVLTARAHFIHRDCGLLNTDPGSVLRFN